MNCRLSHVRLWLSWKIEVHVRFLCKAEVKKRRSDEDFPDQSAVEIVMMASRLSSNRLRLRFLTLSGTSNSTAETRPKVVMSEPRRQIAYDYVREAPGASAPGSTHSLGREWCHVWCLHYRRRIPLTGNRFGFRCVETHGECERTLWRRQPVSLLLSAGTIILEIEV